MTKKYSTKRSLIASILILCLCFTSFVGTTFAWFTDEVTSSGNKIVSGSLKVDLEVLDKESGKWSSLKESKAPIFNYENWEPGYIDAKVLKVDNEGTLALKWKAKFVANETLGILADVIDVYVLPYGVLDDASSVGYPAGRDLGAAGYTKVGTVRDFVNTIETTTYGELLAGKSAYLGIALKMQESAGNIYQEETLGAFDIQIVATQLASEEDSFGKDYDSGAEYDGEITNSDGFKAALAAGGTYKLVGDLTLDQDVSVPAGVEAAIDLGGNDLVLNEVGGGAITVSDGSTLTISNGTLKSSADGASKAINATNNVAGTTTVINLENVDLALETPDYDNETANSIYANAEQGAVIVNINAGTEIKTESEHHAPVVVGKNATVNMYDGSVIDLKNVDPDAGWTCVWGVYLEDDSSVFNMYGGVINVRGDHSASGIYAYNVAPTVNIYGGTINVETTSGFGIGVEVYKGNVNATGGTFNIKATSGSAAYAFEETSGALNITPDVKIYVMESWSGNNAYWGTNDNPAGCNPTIIGISEDANYSGLYTDGTNYYIYDAEGLASANALLCSSLGRYKLGFNRTYSIMSDIDATGVVWNSAWMEGGSGTEEGMVFEGNGYTISNLNINGSLLSGAGYDAIIQNITFDNASVQSAGHHVGVIWGTAYGPINLKNVVVKNSNVKGLCNVSALVGSAADDTAVIAYENCLVENTKIEATGVFSGVEGDFASDPTGANVYMGRAFGGSKLVFENCASVNNTIVDNPTLADGGIYAYTTIADGWWTGTGVCDGFANFGGIVTSAGAVPSAPLEEDFLFPAGTNAVLYNDAVLIGDAQIVHTENSVLGLNNVTAELDHDVIVRKSGGAICIADSNFTLTDGAKLITVAEGGDAYQVFLINVTVNGVLLTQENAGQYLEGISWYGVYPEWPN